MVKRIHENLAIQQPFAMLLEEARVAALVKQPHVVDHDLGEVAGRYFIAMEYLEGMLSVLRADGDGPSTCCRPRGSSATACDSSYSVVM